MIIQPVSSLELKCDNLSGHNAVTIFKGIFISKTSHKNNQIWFFWLNEKWIFEDFYPFFLRCFETELKKHEAYITNHPSTWLMSEKRNSVFTLIGCDWRVRIWEILISFSFLLTFKNSWRNKCMRSNTLNAILRVPVYIWSFIQNA